MSSSSVRWFFMSGSYLSNARRTGASLEPAPVEILATSSSTRLMSFKICSWSFSSLSGRSTRSLSIGMKSSSSCAWWECTSSECPFQYVFNASICQSSISVCCETRTSRARYLPISARIVLWIRNQPSLMAGYFHCAALSGRKPLMA